MIKVEDILKKYKYDASVKAYEESKVVQMLKVWQKENSLPFQ
jgi:hypothetical protein